MSSLARTTIFVSSRANKTQQCGQDRTVFLKHALAGRRPSHCPFRLRCCLPPAASAPASASAPSSSSAAAAAAAAPAPPRFLPPRPAGCCAAAAAASPSSAAAAAAPLRPAGAAFPSPAPASHAHTAACGMFPPQQQTIRRWHCAHTAVMIDGRSTQRGGKEKGVRGAAHLRRAAPQPFPVPSLPLLLLPPPDPPPGPGSCPLGSREWPGSPWWRHALRQRRG